MKRFILASLLLLLSSVACFAQFGPNPYLQSIGPVPSLVACTATAGQTQTAATFPCGGYNGMYQNSLITSHFVSWTAVATVSTCTFEFETSSNGTTWVIMTGTAIQPCTSSGSYSVSAQSAAYVRINILSLTTTGSGTIQLNYNSNSGIFALVSCSVTGSATSSAIQTVGQTNACVGLASGSYVFPVVQPTPTSLCPATSFKVAADDVLTVYYTVLTAAACTPPTGTYIMAVAR
jgi:hypothetical protein